MLNDYKSGPDYDLGSNYDAMWPNCWVWSPKSFKKIVKSIAVFKKIEQKI